MNNTPSEAAAAVAGWNVRLSGDVLGKNPYDLFTGEYTAFKRGWWAAQEACMVVPSVVKNLSDAEEPAFSGAHGSGSWRDVPSCGGWWWDKLWEQPRMVWISHTGLVCTPAIHGTGIDHIEPPKPDEMSGRWFGLLALPPRIPNRKAMRCAGGACRRKVRLYDY